MTTQYYIPAGRYGMPPDYPPEELIKMADSYLAAADVRFDEAAYDIAEQDYRSAGICYSKAGVREEKDPLDHIGIRAYECRSRMRNHHPLWVARFTA